MRQFIILCILLPKNQTITIRQSVNEIPVDNFVISCLPFTTICQTKIPGNKKSAHLYGGHLVAFHPRDQTIYYFTIF